MIINKPATIEDLYHVEGRAELVNGQIYPLPYLEILPSYAALEIWSSLSEFEDQTRAGFAFGGNTAFIVNLSHRQTFSPCAGFFVGPDPGMKFFEGAPVFAVEVRNSDDLGLLIECERAEKRADYFAAGILVVWDVHLQDDEVVRVYRASDPYSPTLYRRGEIANAEQAVPGWTFPVDELFRKKRQGAQR